MAPLGAAACEPTRAEGALVGRDNELDRFVRTWRQVGASGGRVFLVEGIRGSGKTRFLRACNAQVRTEGRGRSLQTACREGDAPLAAVRRIIERYLASLARLPPPRAGGGHHGAPRVGERPTLASLACAITPAFSRPSGSRRLTCRRLPRPSRRVPQSSSFVWHARRGPPFRPHVRRLPLDRSFEPRGRRGTRRSGPRGSPAARRGGAPRGGERHLRALRHRGVGARRPTEPGAPRAATERRTSSRRTSASWRRFILWWRVESSRWRTTRPWGSSRFSARSWTQARCAFERTPGSSTRPTSDESACRPAPWRFWAGARASCLSRFDGSSRSRPCWEAASTTACSPRSRRSATGRSSTRSAWADAPVCSSRSTEGATGSRTRPCGKCSSPASRRMRGDGRTSVQRRSSRMAPSPTRRSSMRALAISRRDSRRSTQISPIVPPARRVTLRWTVSTTRPRSGSSTSRARVRTLPGCPWTSCSIGGSGRRTSALVRSKRACALSRVRSGSRRTLPLAQRS